MTSPAEIAPATPEDALGVYATIATAFGGKDEADLVVALLREDKVALMLVARFNDMVIGACVFSRVALESAEGSRAAVALAPLAVLPAMQRCGVGSVLVRDGLLRLKAAGETLALVLGEPSYYGRFGFTAAAAESIRTPWDGPYQQALVLNGPHPGSCRAVYADAFGAFE
jgi:putative acetyltransferase